MLLDLNEHSKTAGLTMNFKKTKIMSRRPTEPFIIVRTEIHLVNEYIYLGQLVTLNMCKKMERSVSQAWKAIWALKIYSPGQVIKQEI
jgi:hypothetical protein